MSKIQIFILSQNIVFIKNHTNNIPFVLLSSNWKYEL